MPAALDSIGLKEKDNSGFFYYYCFEIVKLVVRHAQSVPKEIEGFQNGKASKLYNIKVNDVLS